MMLIFTALHIAMRYTSSVCHFLTSRNVSVSDITVYSDFNSSRLTPDTATVTVYCYTNQVGKFVLTVYALQTTLL